MQISQIMNIRTEPSVDLNVKYQNLALKRHLINAEDS